jgi:colanic acid/amylovoran biosynthesis glycosyltransferase
VPVVAEAVGRDTQEPRNVHRQAQWIAREVAAKQIGHLHAEYAAAEVTRQVKSLTGVSYSLAATGNEVLQNEKDTRSLRQTVDEAEFVIAPSNISWKRLLTASDPSAARKVLRMHPGVDLERVEFHAETGRDPNSILAVCPLERASGLGDLVDAMAVLRDRGRATTRLTIVGEGELEHELRAKIESLGLADRITMLPHVGAARLMSLMRAHAVMALPYETAPGPDRGAVPAVLLQAMAVGLPVVSTQVTGVTEVVEDGWTGRLVDPRDPQWLAGALETLLDNLRLRIRMAKDARLVVERRFALSQNVSLLASLFASAAGQSHGGNALAAHP